ncbi:AlkA N-terminal domain-containing protein [Candidatus Nitrospira salsa]
MREDHSTYYTAYTARDSRFDGLFFVGVTSTGIYCRPICPAKTPKASNCRFFDSAEAAEKESFRPCLRCRPELAPGSAPIDDACRIAHLVVRRIEESLADEHLNVEAIAKQFDLSSRQIRRIVQREFGVSPIELVQTRRLLLAKQLLTETTMPVTNIAFASGFSSLRRFNHAFRSRYGMPPTQLRNKPVTDRHELVALETSRLQLSYRPPFDWHGILMFLSMRALRNVEWVSKDCYARTIQLRGHRGWVKVGHASQKHTLLLEFTHSLTPVLPALLGRIRHIFDLNARPDVINTQLMQDVLLENLVAGNPGLRVPGAFDGFELAVRAILGQQVTVKAATTLACRFVDAFGQPVLTPFDALNRLTPDPKCIADVSVGEIAKLGIISVRAKSIIALARAYVEGGVQLDVGVHPQIVMKQLVALPGIGPWTAQYIVMRAMRWPDAFPKEDVAIRNSLGGVTPKQAEEISQAWRPWRSYAVLHLWNHPRLNMVHR